jgi:hypothetical protein
MSRTEQLEQQIVALDPVELKEFREWFAEYESTAWDNQIENDAKSGALDRIARQALDNHEAGHTTEF